MIKALFLIYLIWGFNWVVMKLAMDYFSPVTFVTYRFLSGAIVLLLVSFIFKHSLPQKKFIPWIFISGAFQIALNFLLETLSDHDHQDMEWLYVTSSDLDAAVGEKFSAQKEIAQENSSAERRKLSLFK